MTFKEDGLQERDQAVRWPQGAPAPPLPKVTGVSRSPPIRRDPLRTHQNVKPKISYLGKLGFFFADVRHHQQIDLLDSLGSVGQLSFILGAPFL